MQRIAREGWRQLVLLVVMVMAFCFLAKNLFVLQVLHSANAQMQTYYAQDVVAPQIQKPPRGMILDANGNPLVGTVTVFKLAASPPYVKQKGLSDHAFKAEVARKITDILFPVRLPRGTPAHDTKAIAKAHATYRTHYAAIVRQLEAPYSYVCLAGDDSPTCPATFDISQAVKDKIDKLGLPGITTEARSQPSYPNGGLAAQVLGFVNYQYQNGAWVDTGQYGVQEFYNNLLSGIPGHVSVRTDTSGQQIRLGAGADAAPQQGATLRLTLDSYVQLVVERELARVVANTHATGATIIVERPSDGAIIAMASTPSYDPTNWRKIVAKFDKHGRQDMSAFGVFKNPAVSNQYEPGSTFKAFTVAIGLDSGSFTQYTPVNDTGTLALPQDGITIRNWCLDSCTFGGLEDVRKMLHYSSNIGAAQFGRMIPVIPWYSYLDRFGFGQSTGVDLAGELPGDIRKPTGDRSGLVWYPAYKDTQAYGQGLTVTPLQLANAYAALDNEGGLMRPHLVQSYTVNGKTTVVPPQRMRQAISAGTADLMKQILVQQAINGEACLALVPGYDIAAKTGTASISAAGGYAPNQTIASTAAFGPVGDPDPTHQFVVLVKVDKPNPQWGSLVASPVVNHIFRDLFSYYKIAPAQYPTQPQKPCSAPDST